MAETMDSVWDDFQHSKDKNHAPFMATCKNHEVRDASHKINVLRIRISRAYHIGNPIENPAEDENFS